MNCFHFKRSILTPLQESLWLFTAAVHFALGTGTKHGSRSYFFAIRSCP